MQTRYKVVIITRAFNKLPLSIQRPESYEKRDSITGRERRSFIVAWRWQVSECVWGWKPADTRAGSNDCWQNCSSSCGWATRPRYDVDAGANRRQIGKMRSIFWVCC
jgi:hypothetical protein